MWVFIRPRGGQECYLLTSEIRGDPEFCPIHRFDGKDQIPMHRIGTVRDEETRSIKESDSSLRKPLAMKISCGPTRRTSRYISRSGFKWRWQRGAGSFPARRRGT
jgi:hypothetical protein